MGSYLVAILVLSVLVLIHELGHFLVARRMGVGVERFSIGFGRRVFGWKRGPTEYWISAIPLGGYVKMVGEHPESNSAPEEGATPTDLALSFEHKSVWKRLSILGAGPASNLSVGVVAFWIVFMIAGSRTQLPVVGSVIVDTPAAAAGLQDGDVIAAIDGETVETWDDLTRIVSANSGVSLEFTVRRGEGTLRFQITPSASGLIGIQAAEDAFVSRSLRPLDAAGESLRFTWKVISDTLVAIVKMIQGSVSTDNISGPIGIVKMGSESVRQGGVLGLLFFVGALSVLLGLFNLFPIPVLDGGNMWFLAIEAVRGRPLSRTVQERVMQVGFVLIVLLMLFAFYNDIYKIYKEMTGK